MRVWLRTLMHVNFNHVNKIVAWENSRNLATLPLVSPPTGGSIAKCWLSSQASKIEARYCKKYWAYTKSWVRFNCYVYARPFIHGLYCIYARKIYVRTHRKITWHSCPCCNYGGEVKWSELTPIFIEGNTWQLWSKLISLWPSVNLKSIKYF